MESSDKSDTSRRAKASESTPQDEAPRSDARGPRRLLLKGVALACGAGAIATVAVPAAFVVAPDGRGSVGARWIRTVRLDGLRDGEAKRVVLRADVRDAWTLAKDQELGAVWLVRKGDSVRAMSAVCPHLGCAIDARKGAPGFTCPCHDSDFGASGERLTGPSPRDMDGLATRIEDGYVVVDYRAFRQGTKERVEVG